MARIEEIERRLLNWARWRLGAGAGGLGYASVKMDAEAGRAGYREAVVPTVDCEAEETDQAVMALPSELRRTVEVVYLEGGCAAAKACRLAVAEPTVKARVWQAHRKLADWLRDREAGRRVQRARVEALQVLARPGRG
jgi:hypothetical protein